MTHPTASTPADPLPLSHFEGRHLARLRQRHAEGECAGIGCPTCEYQKQWGRGPSYTPDVSDPRRFPLLDAIRERRRKARNDV